MLHHNFVNFEKHFAISRSTRFPLKHRAKRLKLNAWDHNQDVLQAGCMEEAYEALAQRALAESAGCQGRRWVVGVAGVPGSGKSTLAREVCRLINDAARAPVAVNLPMDGFHYFRSELSAMEDPEEAFARRGAHWTFDASAYVECLRAVKKGAATEQAAPSFDHGTGDPVADDILVHPFHKIIVSEGNYLLLDEVPWTYLVEHGILDDSWFVDCDLDTAMERVYTRQTGNGTAPDVSRRRIAYNDRPNGELIRATKSRARLAVPSLPFCRTAGAA